MNCSIVELTVPERKTRCAKTILRTLPDWFGNEEAISEYVAAVSDLPSWAAVDHNGNCLGFVAVKIHYGHTGDIYVLGILPQYHGQGIGTQLMEAADKYFAQQGCRYVIVKTLSDLVECERYERTRQFYLRVGFEPLISLTEMWDEDNPCLLMIKQLPRADNTERCTVATDTS